MKKDLLLFDALHKFGKLRLREWGTCKIEIIGL